MLSRWLARQLTRLLAHIARRFGYLSVADVHQVAEDAVRRHEARCSNFRQCQNCMARSNRPRSELVRQVIEAKETMQPIQPIAPVERLDACVVELESVLRRVQPEAAQS